MISNTAEMCFWPLMAELTWSRATCSRSRGVLGEEPPRSPPFSFESLLKIFLRNIPECGFPGFLQDSTEKRGKDYAIERIKVIC
jgi:hypothetical protein